MSERGQDTLSEWHTPSRATAEIEFNRIVAFSDGVFAIAITLLVLTLEVPAGVDDLGQELRDRADELFAYAISFAVLGKLWLAHHRFFSSLERFDGTMIALNLLYLAFVALVPFTSDLLGNYSAQPTAVIAYALNLAAISFSFTISIRYAYGRDLVRDWAKQYTRRYAGPVNFLTGGVFLASIPLALLSTSAAQLLWLAIFFVGRRVGDALGRRGEAA